MSRSRTRTRPLLSRLIVRNHVLHHRFIDTDSIAAFGRLLGELSSGRGSSFSTAAQEYASPDNKNGKRAFEDVGGRRRKIVKTEVVEDEDVVEDDELGAEIEAQEAKKQALKAKIQKQKKAKIQS